MYKLILIFYIPHFAQTRAAQCLTNIDGKVRGQWQWRFGGWIRYIDGTQGDGHCSRGDDRRVQKVRLPRILLGARCFGGKRQQGAMVHNNEVANWQLYANLILTCCINFNFLIQMIHLIQLCAAPTIL